MSRRRGAYPIAFAALMAALAVAVLYLGSAVPTGRWGLAALAGLMPAAAVISAGFSSGVLCWAGGAVLGIFLVPDKLMALLFAVLFGLYPLVKNIIERLRRRPLEYLLKLVFFNAAFTLLWVMMSAAVLASLPAVLSGAWMLYLVGNVVFLLYDYGFSRLIALYMVRIARLGKR